jgi:SAM-dependent methyltransferase
MIIANNTAEYLARHPEIAVQQQSSPYDAPYRFATHAGRVLVVGAGAGNDVAAALRHGAEHVDAVEIDPVIFSIGQRIHPDQPYSSPKVTRILDDARAYMRRTSERYDVVMFGLLDSHTQFSDFSNMRIDNYVYTEESFQEARRLLKPGGILVLKFEVRAPWTWMGERFAAILTDVFGRQPLIFYAPAVGKMVSGSVFIESNDPALWQRAQQPDLASLLARQRPPFFLPPPPGTIPTTDDWPYVYHRKHSIPGTYLSVSLLLLVLACVSVRSVLQVRRAGTWKFFFLGAGFLLLETQLISRLALYFGTTWVVNCVAITAILLVLVLANAYVERRHPPRLGPYYFFLAVFLAANYLLPWHALPLPARVVGLLLSVAYAVPVFFAGVIFGESFCREREKSSAFGANIVGAVAGGLAQNASFVIGMKALLILAALFYIAAALFHRAAAEPGGDAPVLAAQQHA